MSFMAGVRMGLVTMASTAHRLRQKPCCRQGPLESEMIDLEAKLVLSDPYMRVLEEDQPEFKCHCCHQLHVRF